MSVAAAAIAAPVAALVVWALLRSPLVRRVVAAPRGDRWHELETPSFGGVGIFLGLAAGVGAALLAGVDIGWDVLAILGGCAIVFAAGLFDDLYSLGPLAKLAAQGGAAALVLTSGLSVHIVHNDVLAAALGVAWLIGITNAFNLLDNMDGLAASLATVAAVFFAIDAVTTHPDHALLAFSIAVALACCGFLPFNLRPGRPAVVFMGDSGSQVLGFALASLGLATSYKVAETTIATLLLPILILAVPILDTALVTVVRLLEGRPVYQGGRDHTSHRLVYRGLSESRTVVLLATISAALGASSLAYSVLDNWRITLVGVLLTFALLVQFASFLTDIQRRPPALRPRAPMLLQALVFRPRRLIEMLVDSALITAAFFSAYLLHVNGSGTVWQRHMFTVSLPIVLAARYAVFIPSGLYRGVWRYAGAQDAARAAGAVVLSEGIAFGFIAVTSGPFFDFPQSIYVVDALICIPLIVAARFAERALFRSLGFFRTRGTRRRTLIVGAGREGRSLLRELRETPGELVVGFLDDDPQLRRRRLQGAVVLGSTDEIDEVLETKRPDSVLVTIVGAERERLEAISRACESAGVECRFVRRQAHLDPLEVLDAVAE